MFCPTGTLDAMKYKQAFCVHHNLLSSTSASLITHLYGSYAFRDSSSLGFISVLISKVSSVVQPSFCSLCAGTVCVFYASVLPKYLLVLFSVCGIINLAFAHL
jgi:hypothetical protein